MIKLSAAIITYNEEQNIERCLSSLSDIADEIIVADSGSTDRTKEICLKYNVKFLLHPFTGHIEQKNFALSQCSFDYVLSIDADECLSEDLKTNIRGIKNNWVKDGYYVNRLTNYCGKWIHHCGWYPDKKLRLFKKDKGKWGGSNPHDRMMLNDPQNFGQLKADLLHYSYYTIEGHLQQVNKFTTIGADSEFKSGKRTSLLMIIFKPIVRFFRDYFFHLGLLDGYYGFVICRISAHAVFIKNVKLYQLQKNKT